MYCRHQSFMSIHVDVSVARLVQAPVTTSACLYLLMHLQIYSEDNQYLSKDREYQRQMKNLQWFLGNPFLVLVSIDTEKTQVNDTKDDIIDDALLRDIFYGSIQVEIGLHVLKRFEKGLASIRKAVDEADANAAAQNAEAAAAAKRRRTEAPRQELPKPPKKPPAKKTNKAAKPVASKPRAADARQPSKQQRRPLPRSPSVGSIVLVSNCANAFARLP